MLLLIAEFKFYAKMILFLLFEEIIAFFKRNLKKIKKKIDKGNIIWYIIDCQLQIIRKNSKKKNKKKMLTQIKRYVKVSIVAWLYKRKKIYQKN